uniref:EF-hand domain-containing protein n=1 Tax=Leersia perrieri TaxID=77586 RepID=A0A0D9W7K5_9ORYZ
MARGETGGKVEQECAAGGEPMNDYEKQRLARIRENEARIQALGIRRLAASPLLHSPAPSAAEKGKRKSRAADADEEYIPSDGGEDDDKESSSSGDRDGEEEEDINKSSSSRSRKKGKKKMLNSRKSSKVSSRKEDAPIVDFVDDDAALQQAIALSLAESSENPVPAMSAETSSAGVKGSDSTPREKSYSVPIQDSTKTVKIKMQGKSRIRLTEDDVIAFFFSFDEVGKGYITPWDLERMATVHDFIWTDFEISKMIHCFENDRDGKINLEDFRTIVSRCNMLQEPGK